MKNPTITHAGAARFTQLGAEALRRFEQLDAVQSPPSGTAEAKLAEVYRRTQALGRKVEVSQGTPASPERLELARLVGELQGIFGGLDASLGPLLMSEADRAALKESLGIISTYAHMVEKGGNSIGYLKGELGRSASTILQLSGLVEGVQALERLGRAPDLVATAKQIIKDELEQSPNLLLQSGQIVEFLSGQSTLKAGAFYSIPGAEMMSLPELLRKIGALVRAGDAASIRIPDPRIRKSYAESLDELALQVENKRLDLPLPAVALGSHLDAQGSLHHLVSGLFTLRHLPQCHRIVSDFIRS